MNNASSQLTRYFGPLLFCGAVLLYTLTAAPGLMTDDQAEFQHLCATLGKAHPPGFPVLLLLGKIFAQLPLGQIAWRVTLLSVLSGALAILCLYHLLLKLALQPLPALLAALTLLISHTFWMHAVLPEVYNLNALFHVLMLRLALDMRDEFRAGTACALALLLGIAIGNHQTAVFMVPVYVLWIVYHGLQNKSSWINLIWPLLAFLTGTAVLFVLPLRFAVVPGALEGGRTVGQEFVYWISGGHLQSNFAGWDFDLLVARTAKFLMYLIYQFFGAGIILGIYGCGVFFKADRGLFIITLCLLLFTAGMGIVFLSSDVYVYFIPAYLVFAIWIGFGIAAFFNASQKVAGASCTRARSKMLLPLLLLAVPLLLYALLPGILNRRGIYLSADKGNRFYLSPWKHGVWFFEDACRHLLGAAEDDGFIQSDWNYLHTFHYLQQVENFHPDVTVVNCYTAEHLDKQGWSDFFRQHGRRKYDQVLATQWISNQREVLITETLGAGVRGFFDLPAQSSFPPPLGWEDGVSVPELAGLQSFLERKQFKTGECLNLRLRFPKQYNSDEYDQFLLRAVLLPDGPRSREHTDLLVFNKPLHGSYGLSAAGNRLIIQKGAEFDSFAIDTWIPREWGAGDCILYLALSNSAHDALDPEHKHEWMLEEEMIVRD